MGGRGLRGPRLFFMAWLFVPSLSAPESAESTSGSSLPSSASLWVTSSGKPVRRLASWKGWDRRDWIRHLSGTISEPSTASRGAAEWISLLEESHASHTAPPASNSEAKTTGISSMSSLESWAKFDPVLCSWKKSQASLFETDLDDCSGSWPNSGSMRSGAVFQREELERHTSGAGCSFSRGDRLGEMWPTPRTITGGAESAERKKELGRTESGGGDLQAAALKYWPTPTAGDEASTRAANYSTESGRHSGTTLTDAACPSGPTAPKTPDGQTSKPRLNPRFVEALMGMPRGWTSDQPCASLATEWSLWRSRMRSELLRLERGS